MSTLEAAFRGGIPLVNLDEVASIPLRFIFQLGHKLTPPDITDRFAQGAVLDHVLHVQTLDADRLIVTDIEMSQGLLQRDRRDVIEPGVCGMLLQLRQGQRQVLVIQALLLVIEGVCLLVQRPIVDEATAAESASKNLLLLVRWVHAVLVGAFLLHVLHNSKYGVDYQGGSLGGVHPPQPPSKERASYPQC